MSGGVDSAVAAARARDAGHEVVGVHLALSRKPATAREGARGCCTLDDARDARRAADVLEIPFYVWDLAERFAEDVIDDFADSYARGETPNPCLRCNERIKFTRRARACAGAGFRRGRHRPPRPVSQTAEGPVLRRSVDLGQGPVLRPRHAAPRAAGEGRSSRSAIRPRRGCAKRRPNVGWRWPTSLTAPTSASCLRVTPPAGCGSASAPAPGPVVDAVSGAVVGGHDGAFAYTVGQRRGLALSVPASDGQAALRARGRSGELHGHRRTAPASLDVGWLEAQATTYIGPPIRCLAQVRAHGTPVWAHARREGDVLRVEFEEPLRAVARGQAVVLYAAGSRRRPGARRRLDHRDRRWLPHRPRRRSDYGDLSTFNPWLSAYIPLSSWWRGAGFGRWTSS